MQRFWLWIGRGADIAQLITFGLAIPAAAALAIWWLWRTIGSPGQALSVGVAAYVVLQIVLAAVAVEARRQASQAPHLDIQPTGGPSPDVRLVVTNRGKSDDFHVQSAIIACRNHGNVHKQGSYAVPWLDRQTDHLSLVRLKSHALFVARFDIHQVPGPPMFRMGEVQLIEWTGGKEQVWDWFRWVMEPGASLPEFDIDLTFRSVNTRAPLERSYTIRPSKWSGPVELIAKE